jgi:hypothetical protein
MTKTETERCTVKQQTIFQFYFGKSDSQRSEQVNRRCNGKQTLVRVNRPVYGHTENNKTNIKNITNNTNKTSKQKKTNKMNKTNNTNKTSTKKTNNTNKTNTS